MAALALVALLLASCDALISDQRRVERAEQALASGNFAAAMSDAKAVLESEPGRVDARLLLARVMLRFGDAAAARDEFDRALKSGADPETTRELHYRIMAAEGRHQDLLIAVAADEAMDPRLRLRLQAGSEIAVGKPAQALATIREALADDSADIEARFIETQALWASGQPEEAVTALDDLLRRQPEQPRWWLHRGRFAMGQGQPAAARDAFQKAREMDRGLLDHPEQLAVLAGLVEANLAAGDQSAAEKLLAELDQSAPESFVAQFLKGRVAFARGDYATATAEIQRALVLQPGVPFARLLLGASLLQQGSFEQADSELSQLLAEQPGNAEARTILARVHLARGDPEAARQLLANAPRGGEANAGAAWMMGTLLLQSGQADEAIALMSGVAAASPDNIGLQLELARAHLLANRAEQAAELLATLPADQGGRERQQLTVLSAVRGQSPAEGRRRVAALLSKHPRDIGVQLAAGNYLLGIGDIEAAGAAYAKAAALDGSDADALVGLAAVAVRNSDLPAAEAALRKALAARAGDERILLALADVARARRDQTAARAWLEQAVSANPGAVEPRLRLAEMSFAANDPVRADALLNQALEVARNKGAAHHRTGLIRARYADFDRALTDFDQAAAQGVEGAGSDAARALVALGREAEARSRLEGESRRQPKAVLPVAMLASLDLKQKQFDRALERIAAFEKAGGSAADVAEVRGDIYTAAGRHDDAARSFALAARIRPSEALAIKEFGARGASGASAPEAPLQRWLEKNPRTPAVRFLLGQHYHLRGQRAAAIEQYELASALGPHSRALNNLANLYHEAGDARALETARKAFDAAPENAAIADTYGWILLEQGHVAEGMPILESAVRAAPSHPEIRFHHAAALARVGRKAEAAGNLRKLLGSAPQFESRAAAETLLASLDGG